MGEHILNNISPNGFFTENRIDCLTSVYPSTTTAALTTYYAGRPPYETGWIAWSQYFKEYGRTVDMFSRKESYLKEDIDKARMNVFKGVMAYKSVFKMIEEATKNATAAGEQFAKDANAKLGKIQSANQGLFSITARDQTDAWSDNEKQSINKRVRVVSTITFYLR